MGHYASLSHVGTIERTSGCLIFCTYEWLSGEEAASIFPSKSLIKLYLCYIILLLGNLIS